MTQAVSALKGRRRDKAARGGPRLRGPTSGGGPERSGA